MSEYRHVTLTIPGEDEDFDMHVPAGLLPRVGDTIDLSTREDLPSYVRLHPNTVESVFWYPVGNGRYQPSIVIEV